MEDIYRLLRPQFEIPEPPISGGIGEVVLGATSKEGGSRRYGFKLGGNVSLPFYSSKEDRKPVLASLIYDSSEALPAVVREELGRSAEDPVEWADLCLRNGADAVALKFSSDQDNLTDMKRKVKDLTRRVLDEVASPLVLCASEDSQNSANILRIAAETAAGEKCIIAPATLEGDYKSIVEAAVKYGHSVAAETDCDPPLQRSLNQKLTDEGLPFDQLVMDPTSAALGLGIEYSVSIIEQIKLDALKGDEILRAPIVSLKALEYSWKAREAWDPEFTSIDPKVMGPIWEAHSALTLYLAGADLLAMLHPKALYNLSRFLSGLTGG